MENQDEKNVEIVINENTTNANKKNSNLKNSNNQNYGELTREQFEYMKKIREETISRSERYSELINESNSNDFLFKISDDNKKKKKLKQIIVKKESKDSTNNTFDNLDKTKKEEDINTNKERIFSVSQPLLFMKDEPYIILGPDTHYYVWIFSITSFFSIIVYSVKNSNIFFKLLFILGYLFYAVTYTLLLLVNPGIPTNKSKLDHTMLQTHYRQCPECNSITFVEKEKLTIHCEKCKICIEHFHHHCKFATKCIGRGNKKLFQIWLYSIGIYFLIILLYLIF